MKKLFALIISSMLIFNVSCSKNNMNAAENNNTSVSSESAIDYDNIEVVRWEADHIFCYDFEDLEKYSEIAVIGTITDEPSTVCKYGPATGFDSDVLSWIYSYNTIKVEKVLKGDVNIGDEITAIQACGIHDGKLVTFSDMEPMKKGDRWIFFLISDSTYGGYWCVGDYSSRFPVPEAQTATLSRSSDADSKAQLEGEIEKMTNEDFGVYDDITPMRDLYLDVITNYDCTLQ